MSWLALHTNITSERSAALLLGALAVAGAAGDTAEPPADLGNATELNSSCADANGTDCAGTDPPARQYWFLLLVLIPLLSVFGNVLVILAVWRERSLQSATNYFIVSLAVADLLVSAAVMPFAVYVQVNGIWGLPSFVCDLYIATDVTSSTSSIFNLVAISIDRYIAVTQPIKYAKHKNNNRVIFTIILVWMTSAAIGAPLVLGLNVPADGIPREEQQCIFYNSDFIIYSSLSSFYIPCVIMVCLYYRIFQAIRLRARQAAAAKKPKMDVRPSTVIENMAQTKQQETTLSVMRPMPDKATNTGSNSQDEDDEDDDEGQEDGPDISSPNDIEDCHIISNKSCAELPLVTLPMASPAGPSVMVVEANGHHDSGYVDDSNVNPLSAAAGSCPGPRDSLLPARPGPAGKAQISGDNKLACKKAATRGGPMKDKKSKRPTTSRFTIYKVNKASRKKREKNSAKRERKATKTLAIVLGVFLACWVPFFTCNVVDAICMKKGSDCSPGLMAFFFTTWIGYMNSFANPVIYTIFNLEFRKAFKRLLSCAR